MTNGKLKGFLKTFKLNESSFSTILGVVVVVVVGILLFNYFRNVGQPKTEPSLTPTEQEQAIVPEGLPTVYKVEKGDHLWKIAEKFYTSGYNWVDIAEENNIANPNLLYTGQELNLPKTAVRQLAEKDGSLDQTLSGDTYTVQKGDYLWAIAVRAYGDGYKWVEIARANNLTNPNLVHPGNVLKLPR